MSDDELRAAIRAGSVDGKVSCSAMLALAAGRGVPPARIGALCDEMKIRISACQLGCFP
jgi:hypothetical protein